MSDDAKDAKKTKKDTGGKPRPKRDPNQPLAKAEPSKGSKLVKLLAGGLVLIVVALAGMYSAKIGRMPWEWSQEDSTGFVDFSKQQAVDAADAAQKVDWETVKGSITEKTRELWEKIPAFEAELDKKLAELQGKRTQAAAPAPSTAGGAPGTSTAAAPAAAATPPEPTDLEKGCSALRDGIRLYRGSMNDQKKLKASKAEFRKAYEHLEKAHAAAEAANDAQAVQEIEGYLMQTNTYLEDCSKRETLR